MTPVSKGGKGISSKQMSIAELIMQHYATKIIQCLAQHGSRIDLLGAAQYTFHQRSNNYGGRHKFMHRRLRYFYVRGQTVDANGDEEVLPVFSEQVPVEIP